MKTGLGEIVNGGAAGCGAVLRTPSPAAGMTVVADDRY
ncbi:hypothetical protein C7475_101269 [Chitinophaga sp. S165]|nr:hypothetical protein C7475_101269 [Chitinophaga sp. S165]